MAACGSLQHIFEKPLPESPTLLESLSPWKQIKSMKHNNIEDSSYTEIFGELHFKENHAVSSSSSSISSPLPQSSRSSSVSSSSLFAEIHPQIVIESPDKEKNDGGDKNGRGKSPTASYYPNSHKKQYRHSDSFSSRNSESLSLCTEGLGFESFDDVEDLRNETSFDFQLHEEKITTPRYVQPENSWKESKRSRTSKGSFPPPISCIGRTGKPWVCFKSYRQDGRFILQEIRIPTQEFLHACREDGRLRLQFIQSDDEILEGDEEDDEDIAQVGEGKAADDQDQDQDYNCHCEKEENNEENDDEKKVQTSTLNVGSNSE